ncbi:MAG TPA: serine hydrolase domain-containing protein [Polyangiaceae bacterium]|nr:serine hydrolase domain-containing protein [Polyangiaceae bacterium]
MAPRDRMREVMAGHVERGTVPGVVTLIWRRGETRVEALGATGIGGATPMRRNSIFRISSMSKPVAAAAAMILVEDGTLRLDDPVDRHLPELADRRILARLDGPLDETVPAARPITLRDLLTFRMGFGMVWGPPEAYPVVRAANALKLGAFGPPKPHEPPAPDEWMRRFATLPLMHQPGERWMYNTAAEVLSVLLARASGKTLDALLRERIFEPLGMKDTSFAVPASKIDRFVTSYMARHPMNPDGGPSDVFDEVDGQWASPPAFPSGAAGLVSTVDDYLAFGRMLLGGGKLGGQRVLSADSVEAMTTDHITPAQKAASEFAPNFWKTQGWGFGMAVVTAPDHVSPVPGRYGWDGGLGTSWCSDPKRDMVAILMTQRAAFPGASAVHRDFWTIAYEGLDA